MQNTKLNLGCGHDIRAGYVNLDVAALPGVDVVHDLAMLPLPFADAVFEEIVCQDVLEHVDFPAVLQDLHRILQTGGRLHIRVPHFTSRNNFIDPTHLKTFSIRTFDFFVPGGMPGREYYFEFQFSAIRSRQILFERSSFLIWNRLLEPLVNLSPRVQNLYEVTGWSRLFPAENIQLMLVK